MSQSNNKTNLVWRSIKDNDADKNGFLMADELENCFREHFPHDLQGKSLIYFFRKHSTDHDKNLINYRKVNSIVLSKI